MKSNQKSLTRPTNPDMIHIYFAPINQPTSVRVENKEKFISNCITRIDFELLGSSEKWKKNKQQNRKMKCQKQPKRLYVSLVRIGGRVVEGSVLYSYVRFQFKNSFYRIEIYSINCKKYDERQKSVCFFIYQQQFEWNGL